MILFPWYFIGPNCHMFLLNYEEEKFNIYFYVWEICMPPLHSARHAFVDALVCFLPLFEYGVMEQKRNT